MSSSAPTLPEPRPDDEGRETGMSASGAETPLCSCGHRKSAHQPGRDVLEVCYGLVVGDDGTESTCNCVAYRPQGAAESRCARCGASRDRHFSTNEWCETSIDSFGTFTPHPAPLGATDEGLRARLTRVLDTQHTYSDATDWRAEYERLCRSLRAALQAGG